MQTLGKKTKNYPGGRGREGLFGGSSSPEGRGRTKVDLLEEERGMQQIVFVFSVLDWN